MVEVDKRSLFATTPLRTCVNSSVKQTLPSEVSIDDCLLKGLSALANLYTMKLGIKSTECYSRKISPSSTSAWRLMGRHRM
jgi:hypothetical protein